MSKLANAALEMLAGQESALEWSGHKIEVLEDELAAAMADLKDAEIASCDCLHCKHYFTPEENLDCIGDCMVCEKECRCRDCNMNDKWEWRGV